MEMLIGRIDVKYLRRELLKHIQATAGQPTTIDQLAERTGCSYRTALRHRDALEKLGFITYQKRKGRDTGGSVYQLSNEAVAYLDSIW